MIGFKIILLMLLLNWKLSVESYDETDMFYDEFSEPSGEHEDDVFFISGGIPIENSAEQIEKCIVSIRTSRPTLYFGDNHFCAGTLIGSNLVLTAAHCVTDQNRVLTRAKRVFVVAGSGIRLKRLRTSKEFKVKKITVHPQYERKKQNDLAILKLNEPIPRSNDKIKIASLLQSRVTPGTNCSILGWGQLFLYGPYVNNLLYAPLVVLPPKLCQRFYPEGHGNDLICATSYENQGSGTCRGDSGGPLFCPDEKGVHRLAGIVAWSYQCTGEKPSLFTSIRVHYDWIREASSSSNLKVSLLLFPLLSLFFYTTWT